MFLIAPLYACKALALYSAEDCIHKRLLKLLFAVEAHPAESSNTTQEKSDLKRLFMAGASGIWGQFEYEAA